ncbi:hypothetical protein Clacol_008752 [Clathrus columnatus]|uniref:Uncharacterized protein n=1 Tax=Clathrus columnatus TaxID=1419009 RepID=A0AAV5AP85_9AGAM|nr:hypothetical protein Clacol_008752 [Clathrus columnatus]
MPRNSLPRPETAAALDVPRVLEEPQHLPEDNLQKYVHSVKISSPPLVPNHPRLYCGRDDRIPADHFLLSISPDSRFRLRQIRASKSVGSISRDVRTLMLATAPSRVNRQAEDPRDHIRLARFNLPAPGFTTFVADPSPLIDNAMGFAKYISQMMLETAEAVLNLAWPNASRGHTFIIPTDSVVPETDKEICVPLYYTKVRESDLVNIREPMVKLVVIVLPPWTCAMGDFNDIISMKQFPAFEMNPDGTRHTFSRAQKIWAQYQDGLESFVPKLSLTLSLIPVYLSGLSTGAPLHLKFQAGGPQQSKHCSSDNPDVGNYSRLQYPENPASKLDAQQWIDEFLGMSLFTLTGYG